jgi:hypothetical protein
MAETNKEKADNLMLDISNLMKNSGFSNHLVFCIGDNNEGGFGYTSTDKGKQDVRLQAIIFDTLRHNKELHSWLKNIVDQVK